MAFDCAWDYLPIHKHDAVKSHHNVVVLSGEVALFNENMTWIHKLKTGDIYDFNNWDPHGICALVENTKIANFSLYPSMIERFAHDAIHATPITITRSPLPQELREKILGN